MARLAAGVRAKTRGKTRSWQRPRRLRPGPPADPDTPPPWTHDMDKHGKAMEIYSSFATPALSDFLSSY